MESKKISDSVNELVEMWWEWMKHDGIARDVSLPINQRKASVDSCEDLIKLEYNIISRINDNFEK